MRFIVHFNASTLSWQQIEIEALNIEQGVIAIGIGIAIAMFDVRTLRRQIKRLTFECHSIITNDMIFFWTKKETKQKWPFHFHMMLGILIGRNPPNAPTYLMKTWKWSHNQRQHQHQHQKKSITAMSRWDTKKYWRVHWRSETWRAINQWMCSAVRADCRYIFFSHRLYFLSLFSFALIQEFWSHICARTHTHTNTYSHTNKRTFKL